MYKEAYVLQIIRNILKTSATVQSGSLKEPDPLQNYSSCWQWGYYSNYCYFKMSSFTVHHDLCQRGLISIAPSLCVSASSAKYGKSKHNSSQSPLQTWRAMRILFFPPRSWKSSHWGFLLASPGDPQNQLCGSRETMIWWRRLGAPVWTFKGSLKPDSVSRVYAVVGDGPYLNPAS